MSPADARPSSRASSRASTIQGKFVARQMPSRTGPATPKLAASTNAGVLARGDAVIGVAAAAFETGEPIAASASAAAERTTSFKLAWAREEYVFDQISESASPCASN